MAEITIDKTFFVALLISMLLGGISFGLVINHEKYLQCNEIVKEQHDRIIKIVSQRDNITEKYHKLHTELCNIGISKFCEGSTFSIYTCSEKGEKECHNFYNGEFCVTHYCDETGTEVYPSYTVILKP